LIGREGGRGDGVLKCSGCGGLLSLAERAKGTTVCDGCTAVVNDQVNVGPAPALCAFCGGGPLTVEDVFPQWLGSLLPKNKQVLGVLGDPMQDKILRTSGGLAYQAKARCVCATCNNAWMSALEREAQPLIRPMITGNLSVALQGPAQKLLARWAMKTALMIQYVQPQVLVPRSIYAAYHQQRVPSQNARVWIARYDGRTHPSGYHSYLLDATGTAPDGTAYKGHIVGVTFHFDKLVCQIFDQDMPGGVGFDFAQDHQIARSTMLSVWPTGLGRQWPPRNTLDAAGLDAVKRTFDNLADSAPTLVAPKSA
jgi:hypothetical protein